MSLLEQSTSGRASIIRIGIGVVFLGGLLTMLSDPILYAALNYVSLGAFKFLWPIIGPLFVFLAGLLCVNIFFRAYNDLAGKAARFIAAGVLAFIAVPAIANSWVSLKADSLSKIEPAGNFKDTPELMVHIGDDGDLKLSKITRWLLANTPVETIYSIYDDDLDFYLNNTRQSLLASAPRNVKTISKATKESCNLKRFQQNGYKVKDGICVRSYLKNMTDAEVITNALSTAKVKIRKWTRVPLENCRKSNKKPIPENHYREGGICLKAEPIETLPDAPVLSYVKQVYNEGPSFKPALVRHFERWTAYSRTGKRIGTAGTALYETSPYPFQFTLIGAKEFGAGYVDVKRKRHRNGPTDPAKSLTALLLGTADIRMANKSN